MRITVLTSNQPRHLAFVRKLAKLGDVTAVIETMPLSAGKNYHASYESEVMRRYFERVIDAEFRVFGSSYPLENVRVIPLSMGDASELTIPARKSDCYIVFGASYLKDPAIDWLTANKAINIHMGISPQYRGSSCNFWAMYDDKPEYVGATIHMLTKGLDSGPILFQSHAPIRSDPFVFTMSAVESAQNAVCERIRNGTLFDREPIPQDKAKEIRYTKASDFTDEIAQEFLERYPA